MDTDTEHPTRGPLWNHTDDPKKHCVAFRQTAGEFARMQPFFAAFEDRRMSTAMRWLLEQPAVVETMKAKMREGLVQ